jgi:hypothetical protein
VLLSFLIIAFVLGRHYLLGDPPQLTTSPEAIFPSTLGLDCALNAADDDAKVRFRLEDGAKKNHIF